MRGRKAHRSGFSARDLLAVAVVKSWVEELGGQVSYLRDHAEELFMLCGQESWPRLEQSLLIHDLKTHQWNLIALGDPVMWDHGAIVLPIGRLASQLREQLVGENRPSQKALDFPLMSIDVSNPVEARGQRGRVR